MASDVFVFFTKRFNCVTENLKIVTVAWIGRRTVNMKQSIERKIESGLRVTILKDSDADSCTIFSNNSRVDCPRSTRGRLLQRQVHCQFSGS